MARCLIALLFLFAAIPVAAIATFSLSPFWRWFETATALESIGHSGPAEWCYGATYGLLLLVSVVTWRCLRRRSSTAGE